MYDLEEIRARVSLVALAEEAGAVFNGRISSHCPLPLHAGDRSSKAFSIYDNGRRWKCHSSCPSDANGGDVIQFYMLWKEVDFKTACAELTARIGASPMLPSASKPAPVTLTKSPIPPAELWRLRAEQFIFWAEANLASEAGIGARAYLDKERGLSPETQRAFRLGYNPTNLYDDPTRWGLDGRNIWLPRGIVIPGFSQGQLWYVKIRRPLPGDALGKYIGAWHERDGLPDVKFGGLRGGRSTLFRLEMLDHLPVLILAEGEFDVMLLWEYCPDFCDAGTLGSAGAKFDSLDLALLTRYLAVLVVHDDDKAGEEGRRYIAALQSRIGRIIPISPPAHDLTDFWKSGGDLRAWAAGHVARVLEDVLKGMQVDGPVLERWNAVSDIASRESKF
jgi:DNA primase